MRAARPRHWSSIRGESAALERRAIRAALVRHGWLIQRAAAELDVTPAWLRRWIEADTDLGPEYEQHRAPRGRPKRAWMTWMTP